MQLRAYLPIATLILLSACAPPRQTAPASNAPDGEVDPVGTFQYQMNFSDPATAIADVVTGQIVIADSNGRLEGEISGTGTSVFPVTQVQVSRNQMVLYARSPEGPITIRLIFNGDTFTGEWEESSSRRHQLRGVRR